MRPDKLHQPCSPTEELGICNTHKHRCECGNVWKHCTLDIHSAKEHDEAHTCPTCNAFVPDKFFTESEEAEFQILRRLNGIF